VRSQYAKARKVCASGAQPGLPKSFAGTFVTKEH
jgi:hypothetical protein